MRVSVSRREFLHSAAVAAAGPLILSATSRAEANDRVQLGFIGVGMMGRGHLANFLGRAEVQVVAVCDVVEARRDSAGHMVESRYAKEKRTKFNGCRVFNDFRKLLAYKDVDAVVIATPDHWHSIPCIRAAEANKDIYCEKPLTHDIGQGRKIIDAVRQAKRVLQTGSQQRSEFGGLFRKAVEYVRNGRIGKVKTVRVGVGEPAIACNLPVQEIPRGTDWEMWLGPAPKRGYHEELCPKGIHQRFPAWRRYREYGGGGLADMGAHHFDIAQWALDMDGSGPVLIEPPKDKSTTGLRFVYKNGVEMFHGGPNGCTFEGTAGTIYVDREKIVSTPASILKQPLTDGDSRVYFSSDHRKNWLECLRSRKDPICPPEVGHRSASICHLGNIGYWLRRNLKWDPEAEKFIADDEANGLVSLSPREPWTG